jgi:hypothetical protein
MRVAAELKPESFLDVALLVVGGFDDVERGVAVVQDFAVLGGEAGVEDNEAPDSS